ncbi:MAG: SEC-C metal-binding domain-containing protein [Candidatus Cohnella colombiensis]|uniref:SEC-C metal-binding domain-containing protein n=1 Tax=Candidatus Cohnella colombiensis TaxID=3121368 RepID=A0AA95EW67_9BACL|nr:MAG: SEC-C metal-binding domain-containing protein [Cohnella sp.]
MIDITNLYQERHRQLAIQRSVKSKLEDILPLLSKGRLTEIASSIELSGRSKMNKAELVAELPRNILREYQLDFTLLLSTEEEFRFFQEVLSQPYVQNNDISPGTYVHFLNYGILYTFFNKDKLYFVIPEEVKAALNKLDWDAVHWTRSWEQLVLQYVSAAVNLYGVCTPELVLDIYNGQNEQHLSMLDLEEVTDYHLNRMQDYIRVDDFFVSQYFEDDNQDEFRELLRSIQNKPRYIPNKEQFLKYSDDLYFEMTPQLLQLRLFILNQLCKDAELVDHIIDDIQLACSMEEPLQAIVNELERRNIVFDNMDQVKRFTDLVTEVYNHTRLWSNCGYMPAEMRALTGGSANRMVPGQRNTAVKVGRNDPCTCGSGKKYKKCCGAV